MEVTESRPEVEVPMTASINGEQSDSEDEETTSPSCAWKEGPDIPLSPIYSPFWELWKELAFKLDIENVKGNNWQGLACKLGLQSKIDWIDSRHVPKDSCTRKLFEMYRDEPNSTVEAIMRALETNKRLDALNIMEKTYPEIHKYWEDIQKQPRGVGCTCGGRRPIQHSESIGSNSPTSPVCDGSPVFTRCPQEHTCSLSTMNSPLCSVGSAGCCSIHHQSFPCTPKRARLCESCHCECRRETQRQISDASQDSGCTSLGAVSMEMQYSSIERPDLTDSLICNGQKSRDDPALLETVLFRELHNHGLSLNSDSVSPLFPCTDISIGATEEVCTTPPCRVGKPNQGNSTRDPRSQPRNGKHKLNVTPVMRYTPGKEGNGGVHTIIQSNVSMGGGTVQERGSDQLLQCQEPPIKVVTYQQPAAPVQRPDSSQAVTSMVENLSLHNTFPRSRAQSRGDPGAMALTHRRVVSVPQNMQPQPFRQTITTPRGRVYITYAVNPLDPRGTKQHVADVIKLNDFLDSNHFRCRMEEYDKNMDDVERQKMNVILQEVNFIIVCVSPQYKVDTEDQLEQGLDINMQVAQRTQYVYQFMRNEHYSSNCSSMRFIPVVFEQSSANHRHVPHWLRQSSPRIYKWRTEWQDLVYRLSQPVEIVERYSRQFGPQVVTVHHTNS